jgi:hypothetical protein
MSDFDLRGMVAPLSDAVLRAIRDAIAKELERRQQGQHSGDQASDQARLADRPRPPRAAT